MKQTTNQRTMSSVDDLHEQTPVLSENTNVEAKQCDEAKSAISVALNQRTRNKSSICYTEKAMTMTHTRQNEGSHSVASVERILQDS